VKASTLSEADVENRMVEFLAKYVPSGASPICGNSVHQDRRFLVKYMPKLDAYFHYRLIDVSTLKELARRWKPDVIGGMVKHGKHEALADIHESIEELRYYRAQIMKI
jgi:oligoribonuclease